jgi:prophage regulatory protein
MDDLVFKASAGYDDLSNKKRSFQNSYPTINANRPDCLPTSPHDAVLDFTRESSMENVKSKDRPEERLIRIGEVKRLTGISTATLYRKISAKEFPPPVQLGVAARAWPLSEVQNWIAGRIELRGASMTDTTNKTATVPNPIYSREHGRF